MVKGTTYVLTQIFGLLGLIYGAIEGIFWLSGLGGFIWGLSLSFVKLK